VLTALIVASVATVVFLPAYGVTGAMDIYGAGGAGEWRGVFIHKNALGQFCGVTFGLLAVTGRRLMRSTVLWLISLGLAALCVVKSDSSTGLVLATGLPAIYFVILKPKGALRVLGGITCAIMIVTVMMYKGFIVDTVLTLLGKDETLSGRTSIWKLAKEFAFQYPLTGAGYDYSGSPVMISRFKAIFGLPHVHNSYLDALINLGWLDSGLLLFAIGGALVASWSRRLSEPASATREALTLLLVAWLISGADEVSAIKPTGPMACIGLLAIVGLYSLQRYTERPSPRPTIQGGFRSEGTVGEP
jgi:O-antigen ligase